MADYSWFPNVAARSVSGEPAEVAMSNSSIIGTRQIVFVAACSAILAVPVRAAGAELQLELAMDANPVAAVGGEVGHLWSLGARCAVTAQLSRGVRIGPHVRLLGADTTPSGVGLLGGGMVLGLDLGALVLEVFAGYGVGLLGELHGIGPHAGLFVGWRVLSVGAGKDLFVGASADWHAPTFGGPRGAWELPLKTAGLAVQLDFDLSPD